MPPSRADLRDAARVRLLVGRDLSDSERQIDVLGIDAKLNREKDALHRAVVAEQRRVARQIARGRRRARARLRVTEAMRDPLRRLHTFGLREARAELRRLGYGRALASRAHDRDLGSIFDRLDQEVAGLSVRVGAASAALDLGDLAAEEIARALLRVPGARSVAAALVSSAFTSGLGTTFEEASDLVGGWEYTSILDGARCDECAAKHGTTYASWEEAQADLPDGGPNPDCYGGGRCRCRLVPLPA